jgi:hypothetical protein
MTEEKLRESIRQAIRIVKKKKLMAENQAAQDESTLREVVRKFISAEMKLLNEATPDNDPAPHENTGINVLEDLLKKIIPILETDYKLLTTSSEQRESFRAHIINAAISTLTPVEANNDAVDDSEGDGELDEDVEIDVVDDEEDAVDSKFIDIDPKPEPEEEVEADPRDDFGIEGADVTGRNMAYASFKKVESSIVDAYDLLDNTEDQDLFYDYLVANLKLYFDKFETELDPESVEPTNQAYDTAAQGQEVDTADAENEIDFNL